MSYLQERIEALPEFPTKPILYEDGREPWKTNALLLHVMRERDAALARLGLYHELAREGDERLIRHLPQCPANRAWLTLGLELVDCTCGRDELLKEMEVPRG